MGTNGHQVEYDFYVVFNINSTNITPRLVDSYIDKSNDKKIILKFNKKLYYEDLLVYLMMIIIKVH